MNPIVETKSGKIEGVQFDGYARFLAIPYAKPPVGELRFRKTQPAERWEGVYKADHFIAKCPQPSAGFSGSVSKEIIMSEDCLTLNVWTPACDNKKRPVLFWIHGGGFLTGEASTVSRDGKRLCVEGDIVVVNIQYRLGIFGFYDFSQLAGAKGRFDVNCGLYDQVAALEWVRDNISSFGGDPETITVMGESAGATSVQTLLAIPRLKGFIKRAIMESTVWDAALTRKNAKDTALLLLKELSLSEEEAYKVADLPVEVLVAASNRVNSKYVNFHPMGIATAPVIDGDLLPESPYERLLNGSAEIVPTIIGTTKDEATMFIRAKDKGLLPSSEESMDKFFALNPRIDKNKLLSNYPGYPSMDAFKAIGRDLFFTLGSVYIADAVRKSAPVWMYRFDYAPPVFKMLKLGAVHTIENAFVSGLNYRNMLLFDQKSGQSVAEDTYRFWKNFAKYGNPNGQGEEIWPEYGADRKTFIFNKEHQVICDPCQKIRIPMEGIRIYND